jgi:hypothetical protein
MTATLGEACKHALARRGNEESTGWSMISVEPAEAAGKASEFLGVAIMDGRWRSDMHNGRSTVFRVEAGEHTVSVRVKRRSRVGGYRGRATASLAVVVQPGEHLNLVFGAANGWTLPQNAKLDWFMFVCVVSLGLAAGSGWLAFPILHDAVAWTTRALGVRQPWLAWFQSFVSTRPNAAVFSMFAWVIVAHVCLWKRVPNFSHKSMSPYFLSRKPDFGKPSPVFKQQYVDPFE